MAHSYDCPTEERAYHYQTFYASKVKIEAFLSQEGDVTLLLFSNGIHFVDW